MFPIREYYTNRRVLPASLLVGSTGHFTIEIGCETPNQYIGMAEPDLYILASQGGFRVNYHKGLFGIWIQAMVLAAIGLFAGRSSVGESRCSRRSLSSSLVNSSSIRWPLLSMQTKDRGGGSFESFFDSAVTKT